MKHTFEIYVHVSMYGGNLVTFSCDMSEHGYPLVSQHTVELDVPEYDLVSLQVDGIEKQIAQVRAKAQVDINQLEQRKQELLAIGVDA